MVDLCQYLVGAASPVEVSTSSITPSSEHLMAGDNAAFTVRYSDGSLCTIVYTAPGVAGFGKEYVEVFAGSKVLVIDDFRSLEVHGAKDAGWSSSAEDKGHLDELRAFGHFVREGGKPPIGLDELVAVTRVTFAAAGGRSEPEAG
jgi:hypothetical protein